MKSQAVGAADPAVALADLDDCRPFPAPPCKASLTPPGRVRQREFKSGCLFGRSGEVLVANQDSLNLSKNFAIHRCGHLSGLRVLLAGMINADQSGSVAGQFCDRSVREDKFRT